VKEATIERIGLLMGGAAPAEVSDAVPA
jgi:hypothetical protein